MPIQSGQFETDPGNGSFRDACCFRVIPGNDGWMVKGEGGDTPWKIKMEPTNQPWIERKIIFQTSMIVFHVNRPGWYFSCFFFSKNCSPYLGIDEPIGVHMFHFGLTRSLKPPCEGKPAPTARSIPYDYKWQFPRTGGCLQLKQRGFGMSTWRLSQILNVWSICLHFG